METQAHAFYNAALDTLGHARHALVEALDVLAALAPMDLASLEEFRCFSRNLSNRADALVVLMMTHQAPAILRQKMEELVATFQRAEEDLTALIVEVRSHKEGRLGPTSGPSTPGASVAGRARLAGAALEVWRAR